MHAAPTIVGESLPACLPCMIAAGQLKNQNPDLVNELDPETAPRYHKLSLFGRASMTISNWHNQYRLKLNPSPLTELASERRAVP